MPIDRTYLLWAVSIWLASFVISGVIVVAFLVKMPADYFLDQPRQQLWADQQPAIRWMLRLLKNMVGLSLVAAGLLLSLPGIPGQGILTVAIGIMLVDFPGKRRFERSIVSRPPIQGAINRIRCRFGQPPLSFSEATPPSEPQ